jgi:RpiB/LacA/LacB family sugar-phosphate isomerase
MGVRQSSTPPCNEGFVLGSDHAGYDLKEHLKRYLREKGNEVEDLVPEFRDRIDFPAVAEETSRKVAEEGGRYGVLVCGTGLGMCIAANKVRGIRAALLYNEAAAEYARRHNDANVLVFGGRTMTFDHARTCLEIFFSHRFEGGRYAERNDYIGRMEERSG